MWAPSRTEFPVSFRLALLMMPLRLTGLRLWHEDGEWVAVTQGFPTEWHEFREAAERSVWAQTVDQVPGSAWLGMTGDKYVFSSASREEAEGSNFGGNLVNNVYVSLNHGLLEKAAYEQLVLLSRHPSHQLHLSCHRSSPLLQLFSLPGADSFGRPAATSAPTNHTPEFSFEHKIDGIRQAIAERRIRWRTHRTAPPPRPACPRSLFSCEAPIACNAAELRLSLNSTLGCAGGYPASNPSTASRSVGARRPQSAYRAAATTTYSSSAPATKQAISS